MTLGPGRPVVTWSPGAGDCAHKHDDAGSPLTPAGAPPGALAGSPTPPGPRLPPSFSALLCLISALQIYFLHAFLKLWGSLLCLKLVAQRRAGSIWVGKIHRCHQQLGPAPRVGLCVFPGLQGAGSLDGTEVMENPCFRFPAEGGLTNDQHKTAFRIL